MNVYNSHGGNFVDPIGNFGFELLAQAGLGAENVDFYYGGEPNLNILQSTDRKRIFFSTEEQATIQDSTNNWLDYCDEILTICPPSITNRPKRKSAFFPLNEDHIPKTFDKKFGLIYTGFATNSTVNEIIDVICNFDYRYASFGGDSRITHRSISYLDKIKLISESRIYPLHNVLGEVDQNNSQIKSRIFEAAACKSLMLCKRDNLNIIEEWFEPGIDFVYYNDKEDLKNLIRCALDNYEEYLPMVEAAHHKMINNYTTRHFIQKYLS